MSWGSSKLKSEPSSRSSSPNFEARSSDLFFNVNEEHLDDIEQCLGSILGSEELALLHPKLAPQHEVVAILMEEFPWQEQPMIAAERAYTLLSNSVCPSDEHGDVPWCRALTRLHDSHAGRWLARSWFAIHHGARYEEGPVSAVVEAASAYSVALFEMLNGNKYEVGPWLTYAAKLTMDEGRLGLDLTVLVRALRLLRPVLERVRVHDGSQTK